MIDYYIASKNSTAFLRTSSHVIVCHPSPTIILVTVWSCKTLRHGEMYLIFYTLYRSCLLNGEMIICANSPNLFLINISSAKPTPSLPCRLVLQRKHGHHPKQVFLGIIY